MYNPKFHFSWKSGLSSPTKTFKRMEYALQVDDHIKLVQFYAGGETMSWQSSIGGLQLYIRRRKEVPWNNRQGLAIGKSTHT